MPLISCSKKIKSIYKSNTNGRTKYGENFPIDGELDILCQEFIAELSKITMKKGYNQVIEGIELDDWKNRIWNLYENAGLLEGIGENSKVIVNSKFFKDEDEEENEPINWFKEENNDSYEINEDELIIEEDLEF